MVVVDFYRMNNIGIIVFLFDLIIFLIYFIIKFFWDSFFSFILIMLYLGNKFGFCFIVFVLMFDCYNICSYDSYCYGC